MSSLNLDTEFLSIYLCNVNKNIFSICVKVNLIVGAARHNLVFSASANYHCKFLNFTFKALSNTAHARKIANPWISPITFRNGQDTISACLIYQAQRDFGWGVMSQPHCQGCIYKGRWKSAEQPDSKMQKKRQCSQGKRALSCEDE